MTANCHAVSLAQVYSKTPPSSVDGFRQITLGTNQFIVECGEQQVLGPNDTNKYIVYNNTIGSDSASAQTVRVMPKTLLTGTVILEGWLQAGSTLAANPENVPDDAQLSFQWQVCDTPDGAFADIPGATNQTYELTNNEIGKYIRVIAAPSNPKYGGTL